MSKPAPKVFANADAVLRLLGEEGSMSFADIAERTGVPRPSVYRLVDGLAAVRLVETTEDGRVVLGARCLVLADAARSSMVEWAGADAALGELASATHLTAYLSVRHGDDALCVEWAQGRDFSILLLRPGRTLPLTSPVEGHVLLAFAAASTEAPGAATSPAPGPADLAARLARIRADDFAEAAGEVTAGVGAIGVPVRDPAGAVVACVSVAGFSDTVREQRDALLPLIRAAAARLEAGYASA